MPWRSGVELLKAGSYDSRPRELDRLTCIEADHDELKTMKCGASTTTVLDRAEPVHVQPFIVPPLFGSIRFWIGSGGSPLGL